MASAFVPPQQERGVLLKSRAGCAQAFVPLWLILCLVRLVVVYIRLSDHTEPTGPKRTLGTERFLTSVTSIFLTRDAQISKEGDAFPVPAKVARMSELVKETLGDDDDEEAEDQTREIPLPNVSTDVLKKVIEFCSHYQLEEEMTPIQTPLRSPKLDELVQEWYAGFVHVPRNMLFDLVAAANFMDIKPLLDLTCLAVSILIKGKSATELREMFNLSADFSTEEEAQVNRENQAAVAENNA